MKKIQLPMTLEDMQSLHAGDVVYLSGDIYTARDAAHKRLVEMIEKGEDLPFDLKNQTIYYVGPTPAKPGQVIGSAGPTTSTRMDAYTPTLLQHGLQAMIGKGRRAQTVKEAMAQYPSIYFVACGGAGALISHAVKKKEPVAFEDLLSEAIVKLTVEDFPCFVGIDREGKDIYE